MLENKTALILRGVRSQEMNSHKGLLQFIL